MKLIGSLSLRGQFTIRHERNGQVLLEETVDNTATNMGKDQVAGLINETRTAHFKYLALGDSVTEAVVGDTGLDSELSADGLARAAATCTQITTDVTNDTAYLVHTWTASAAHTIKEVGVFDTATSGGRILCKTTNFTPRALDINDTLTVYYKVDVD